MAGFEPLIPHIYHEKQQAGSMLCAQHALNSLLQGNYFTAPDLSDIARNLDDLEESYDDDNNGNTSTNMDDTGFFSVQVLDNALKVWGLNLTRWRSESMRPYHERPQNQLAFILNLEQHWFTLRRFGNAVANVDLDDGNGHWFNLNSFLKAPEWVGKLYLGMVLQQSEAEGYSVFAVTQADPEAPLALPRTQADIIASTLPEPNSSSIFHNPHMATSAMERKVEGAEDHFTDEDYGLQAALQASLMTTATESAPSFGTIFQPTHGSFSAAPDTGSRTPRNSIPHAVEPVPELPGHVDVDPVAASVERNRMLLQQMREQQEYAQREMWSDANLTPEEQAALEERRARRRRQEEEEEEELQRAIAESERLAREDSDQRQMALERGDEPSAAPPSLPRFSGTHRAYDDGDAELQAALRASLEYVSSAPQQGLERTSSQSTDITDTNSTMSDSTTGLERPNPNVASAQAPSLDDIRRARLARFGQ
ncbi:unnamed protein product [Cyclocybe aegerita]|uniref:ubiquitinyl hydrolase 1 n=1 Tax=Cyclocybe aegerita TaxID=1973307 RepID=A0A8S0W8Q6_CYCAE|nr:unnamed protein product [Cyclocybe aegerita]